MTDTPAIEFYAYLPPIQTALTVSGDGDLMQAKFNINLGISPDAARLLAVTGKRLKVTVEELPDEPKVKSGREKTRESDKNKADGSPEPAY